MVVCIYWCRRRGISPFQKQSYLVAIFYLEIFLLLGQHEMSCFSVVSVRQVMQGFRVVACGAATVLMSDSLGVFDRSSRWSSPAVKLELRLSLQQKCPATGGPIVMIFIISASFTYLLFGAHSQNRSCQCTHTHAGAYASMHGRGCNIIAITS
jgi:hypothetical protein